MADLGLHLVPMNRSSHWYRGHAPSMLIGPRIKAHNFGSKGPIVMKLGGSNTGHIYIKPMV